MASVPKIKAPGSPKGLSALKDKPVKMVKSSKVSFKLSKPGKSPLTSKITSKLLKRFKIKGL